MDEHEVKEEEFPLHYMLVVLGETPHNFQRNRVDVSFRHKVLTFERVANVVALLYADAKTRSL